MSRKKTILSESSETTQSSTTSVVRPRQAARERLQSSVLEELWLIWQANPRVPSIKSRRSWAISRNANPRLVDNWFLRRRTCAKKAGQPIPDESYDLPLDLSIAPKREQSTTPFTDLPSDDTLVYPPDINDLGNVETSSDTVLDEIAPAELKDSEIPAYMEVFHQSRPEPHYSRSKPSVADLYATKGCCDGGASFENSFLSTICRQGQVIPVSLRTNLHICIPLISRHLGMVPFDFDAISDPSGSAFIQYPHLDFLPDTLSELSAIPFLYRTPRTVPPDNPTMHSVADDWSVIEAELARLVNGGKLDFSFLDAPHLAAMQLLD